MLISLLLFSVFSPALGFEERLEFYGYLNCTIGVQQWCWTVKAIEYYGPERVFKRLRNIGSEEGCTESRVAEYWIRGKINSDQVNKDKPVLNGLRMYHTCTNGGTRESIGGYPMWFDVPGIGAYHQKNFTLPNPPGAPS